MSERFILIGFLLFVVVILPILLVRDYRHKRKVRQIIESYRAEVEADKNTGDMDPEERAGEKRTKGWGMNNSPFRERKSGLRWGGGNIKASEAKRDNRRKFMR